MRKKAGIALMTLGLVLILSALGLIARNRSEELQGTEAAEQAGQAVTEQIEINSKTEPPAPVLPLPPDVPKELPAVEVEGYPYIGTLGLPVLELELPVMASWSYDRLRIAPCREYGATTEDMVIAGHNYRSHFGRLKNMLPGDLVTFTDMDGEKTAYEVDTVETIRQTDVEKVRDPQWDLVLYTCTYGGNTRVMVGCHIVTE